MPNNNFDFGDTSKNKNEPGAGAPAKASGPNYLSETVKGIGHGIADLGYGAMSTVFPEGPEGSNLFNPTSYANKYAPGWKKYTEEPEKADVESTAREATDIFGPLAIPIGGPVEAGVNAAARLIPGAATQAARVAQTFGRPVLGAARDVSQKAVNAAEKYIAPTASGVAKGYVGGTMQPSKSGDQANQGEVGAVAGGVRAAAGTLPWQVKYGLPGAAILWEEAQRLAGGHGSFGSPYGLWHIPSALSALAGLANPTSSGAAAAQIWDKLYGRKQQNNQDDK